ncbi:5942_t:CDS:2 [Dentiscutata erythropus]|uniref:5942_t:CDS:1 n=1 Tax=Dentiscutata erythropus TaxID=1348616 RepID=A0A9N8WND6_9GLOM|nr:5942_t:CDS:2 [Dentiscutata erythropus]
MPRPFLETIQSEQDIKAAIAQLHALEPDSTKWARWLSYDARGVCTLQEAHATTSPELPVENAEPPEHTLAQVLKEINQVGFPAFMRGCLSDDFRSPDKILYRVLYLIKGHSINRLRLAQDRYGRFLDPHTGQPLRRFEAEIGYNFPLLSLFLHSYAVLIAQWEHSASVPESKGRLQLFLNRLQPLSEGLILQRQALSEYIQSLSVCDEMWFQEGLIMSILMMVGFWIELKLLQWLLPHWDEAFWQGRFLNEWQGYLLIIFVIKHFWNVGQQYLQDRRQRWPVLSFLHQATALSRQQLVRLEEYNQRVDQLIQKPIQMNVSALNLSASEITSVKSMRIFLGVEKISVLSLE